jgi:hypothetical protein
MAKGLEEKHPPDPLPRKGHRLNEAEKRRLHSLEDRRNSRASRLGLDPTLIASRGTLVALASNWEKHQMELLPWQRVAGVVARPRLVPRASVLSAVLLHRFVARREGAQVGKRESEKGKTRASDKNVNLLGKAAPGKALEDRPTPYDYHGRE